MIAINAQLRLHSGAGGIASVLAGLISALGKLEDGPEKYLVIGPPDDHEWLEDLLGSNQNLILAPRPKGHAFSESSNSSNSPSARKGFLSARQKLGSSLRQLFPSQSVRAPEQARQWPEVPISDGFYESLGCDVIHFPWQSFTLCSIPTIYNPHDLQHVHFPQFFSPATIAWRKKTFSVGCRMAQTIVAGSNWIKGDLVNHFGLSPEKVQVIPWASPTEIYPKPASWEVGSVVTKYQLPDRFALYPAMTWEHKNHIRLLKALANLRDEAGIVVNLICTGKRREGFWHQIQDCIDDLKLHGQVRFLGMIPAEELRAIYSLSQFVVVPTLFEAASGPLFEAWQEGVPVACSNVTSLPEQAREAALLFDPFSVDAISTAVRKLASDDRLRAELIRKGGERIQGFSWERTAKAYRALYRKSARQELTDEDRRILERDWMRDPESAAQVAA